MTPDAVGELMSKATHLADVGTLPDPEADPKRPTPSRLYKYKPLTDGTSRERLRSSLVDSRIYFPSRLDFNDPYDCLVPSFFNVEPAEMRRFIRQRLMGMGLRSGDAKAAARMIDLERTRNDLQDVIDKAGILSLTERPENLLMWAHYSSSYTGVCLEFAVSVHETFFGRALPVCYSEKRLMFNPNGTEVENVNATLLTKSADWAYEREWRIIDHLVGKGPKPFAPELLTGVIFGSRISDGDRQQIRELLSGNGRNVSFYRGGLDEREWKIDVVPD
jgi:hypothetical protein